MNWNIDRLTELATGYWKSGVLSAAVELGLFEEIDDKSLNVSEIASLLKTSERHTADLLDALTALELLVKRDEHYALEPGAAQLLRRSSPTCILDALKFNLDLYQLWGHLSKSVKDGKPVMPPEAHLGQSPDWTRRFVLGMHSRALAMAPALLPAIDLRGCNSLLDVASGPGTFSRLLAEKYPKLQVTLFDLPPVLEIARELTQKIPVADRVKFLPGDYRGDEFAGTYDAALFCGAIHQEEPASATKVLKKIGKALAGGGRLFVVDMMLEPDRTSPLFSSLFSLNMMMTSHAGRVHAGEAIEKMLADSGFTEIHCTRLKESPYWVISARKTREGKG